MPKYLLLMYGKEIRMPKNVTPEQMEAGVKPWRDYISPLVKKGVVIHSGPVQWTGKIITGKVAKGYKPREVDLLGCMLIKAKDMEEAVKIAKRSPHTETTTIRECMEIM